LKTILFPMIFVHEFPNQSQLPNVAFVFFYVFIYKYTTF